MGLNLFSQCKFFYFWAFVLPPAATLFSHVASSFVPPLLKSNSDWFMDRLRTTLNVTGDAVVCGMVAHLTNSDDLLEETSSGVDGSSPAVDGEDEA